MLKIISSNSEFIVAIIIVIVTLILLLTMIIVKINREDGIDKLSELNKGCRIFIIGGTFINIILLCTGVVLTINYII